jgi:signal transduction histidine kinase
VIKHYAEKKSVKLICPALSAQEHEIFSRISGDARRYMQIMINFLSNALKFSEDNSNILINIRLNELLAKT